MVRKNQNNKSPNKKSKKSEEATGRHLMFTPYPERESVHKRNLCIVSYPIIFLFIILRSLLYQIFVILRLIYCSSASLLIRKRSDTIVYTHNVDEHEKCVIVEEPHEMSHTTRYAGPGPGDPLLAKQKHHHRRAFEYISKALKIDEENEGIY